MELTLVHTADGQAQSRSRAAAQTGGLHIEVQLASRGLQLLEEAAANINKMPME